MMRAKRIAGATFGASMMASVMLLAACNPPGGSAPGAVSEGEASALEEAAEMLDERQLPQGALPPIDAPIAREANVSRIESDAE